MTNIRMSPNQREVISAISTVTGQQEYLFSTNHALTTVGGGSSGSYPVNVVSGVNSTTTTLSGGAVFTGTSEDVSAYADIRIAIFTDQASATDGLSLQQSADGTNWDQVDNYTIPASTGKAFDVPVYSRYFRIVYTNGPTVQGAFRLQTVYHIGRTKPSSQRPQDARPNDNDMEENLAYMMAYDGPTNSWNRLRGSGPTGTLAISGSFTEQASLTAAALNAFLVPATDVSGYKWASLHVTGTYSGTLTFQASNDNVNWSVVTGRRSDTLMTSSTTTGTNQIWSIPLAARYLRVQMTSYSSGTATGTLELYTQSPAYNFGTTDSSGNQTSNVTNFGAGTFGNSDANSAGIFSALVFNYNLRYNNTTWDRERGNITGAVQAVGATGTTTNTLITYNAQRLAVVINISAFTSGSLTVAINGVTSSGYTYPLLSSTALAATGVTPLRIGPALAPSANAVSNDLLPRTVQVVATVSGTLTYGIDYVLAV